MIIHTCTGKKGRILSIGIIATIILFTVMTIICWNKTTALGGENSQRRDFLISFGWRVSDEATEIADVQIPAVFSDTYTNYNNIQISQGYDLSKYKTDNVKRYTYAVYNYPDGNGGVLKNIYANILVEDEKIIGGDVCSTALDGFMHGFAMP